MNTLIIVLIVLAPVKADRGTSSNNRFEKAFKEASEAAMREALRKTEKERRTLYVLTDK